ncbi:hypothetical protein [Geobacter sp. AOG1]|uniref:hypothetical protein n=1 Tax=Geobacter sp. AOG1 TaxID=1566346 RepID=UPI001CC69055|nr:hypothetical protein [Geobacter sp. AOG1]GFE56804.1 hypothetical protein AOG1_06830 [Geobacter sp. AOG1]
MRSYKKLAIFLLLIPLLAGSALYSYCEDEIGASARNNGNGLEKIKDKKLYESTAEKIKFLDTYISKYKSARGKQLDKISDDFSNEPINPTRRFLSRKRSTRQVRPYEISEKEKIFKIYVNNGTFGKYNNNRPIKVLHPLGFWSPSFKYTAFVTTKDYILPPDKSEIYISVMFTMGSYIDVVPANTVYEERSDKIKYARPTNNPIKIKNVKSFIFHKEDFEDDASFKARLIEEVNELKDIIVNQSNILNAHLLSNNKSFEQLLEVTGVSYDVYIKIIKDGYNWLMSDSTYDLSDRHAILRALRNYGLF